jgi:hypothetical protein
VALRSHPVLLLLEELRMRRARPLTALVALLALTASIAAEARVGTPSGAVPAPTGAVAQQATGAFEVVGHEPLGYRGMNAALAVHGDYAYVGSRTDGKPLNQNLTRGGIMVVDVSNPAAPRVAGEMGPPDEGNAGESSRELRVWKSQDILIVLHTNCGTGQAHLCSASSVNNFRFYDIAGAKAAKPELILTYTPQRNPHEFFLWEDPHDPRRALLYVGPANQRLQVYDLSPLLERKPPTVVVDVPSGVPAGGLHSLTVSNDGARAYFAHLNGGFVVADVSEISAGQPNPQLRLVTPVANRPTWPGPGAHSAVKLWGSDWVLVADEVYGTAAGSGHGCPWGWVRMIDIADPETPQVKAEYKLPQNQQTSCATDQPRPFSSYSAHNPTLTPNIAFLTWHSGGLQAISLADPAAPTQLAEFKPTPLPFVVTEDPRLSLGQDKVVMWSFPIISDGLIYVADLRNGLYILRYTGPFADEVDRVSFLEGNSNIGDALCYEPVRRPGADPDDPDGLLLPAHCTDPRS